MKTISHDIDTMRQDIANIKQQISIIEQQIDESPSKMPRNQFYHSDEYLPSEETKNDSDEEYTVSRGVKKELGTPVRMRVTAYDLSYESCKKSKDHPLYGIGANGEPVKQYYSVAMGKSYEFGTKIYIPYFANWPNKGYFVCTDRGSAIKDNCVDVYFGEYSFDDCMRFGVQYLDVYVLED